MARAIGLLQVLPVQTKRSRRLGELVILGDVDVWKYAPHPTEWDGTLP